MTGHGGRRQATVSNTYWEKHCEASIYLTLFWTGGGGGANLPPSWFFEYSSETVRSRKLKLCDF